MLWNYLNKTLKLVVFCLLSFKGNAIPIIWQVPEKNNNFVGRMSILKAIDNTFNHELSKTVVLAGPSAFGKSQIAKHYIHANYFNYHIIWWFKGKQYLTQQFRNFAEKLIQELDLNIDINSIGHEKLIEVIKDTIRKERLKCLIVFDDVDTYKDIEQYIPFTHDNQIYKLITTKNSNFSNKVIRVNSFNLEESLEYITRFLPIETDKAKTRLAVNLAGCPISIAVAVDFIKSYPGMDINKYLSKYGNRNLICLIDSQEAAAKLESPIDGYKMDLFNNIKLNVDEIRKKSILAYKILGFLSILHHDALGTEYINNLLEAKNEKSDVLNIVNTLKQYSLVDVDSLPHKGNGNLRMHELIQKIVSMLLTPEEKKQHINMAIDMITPIFMERTDTVVEKILKDNTPFLHALRISEEADKLNYHTIELCSLRVRLLDVLVGIIRDYVKIETLLEQINKDFEMGIRLSLENNILLNSNLFLLHRIYKTDFDKAYVYGKKALKDIDNINGMYEEKIRLYSNFIQFYSVQGLTDEAEKYVLKGEQIFQLSKSKAYNALYILAKTVYLNEIGNFLATSELLENNKILLKKQDAYPSMYTLTSTQLCEALIKGGDYEKGEKEINSSEQLGKNFFSNEQNNFFAKLYLMKAIIGILNPNNYEESKLLLNKSLSIYEKIYGGVDKHKNQATVHMYLGRLYYMCKEHVKAKDECLKSERIFNQSLKGKRIYDVSELYKLLCLIGLELKDESMFQEYLQKNIEIFGLDHPNTLFITLKADEAGMPLPY